MVAFDELRNDGLYQDANELCTPEIRDRMWENIFTRINAEKSPADKSNETIAGHRSRKGNPYD